ncbi:MAG: hypothetical protein Q8O71_01675 [bacterium]|nr:hypothetical protein [bacterium]
MRALVILLVVLVMSGCAAKVCVTEGRGHGGDGLPNLFLGERGCKGYASRCCDPTDPLRCECDRTCACWENPDHAGHKK